MLCRRPVQLTILVDVVEAPRDRSRGLDVAECLDLLATADLGHVVMLRQALPVVVPARYVVRGDRVLIHLTTGLDGTPWIDGEVVTLHVSEFDEDKREGWTVSVIGRAHGTPMLSAGDDQPRAPWIAQGGGDLILLSTELVNGERLQTPSVDDDPEAR